MPKALDVANYILALGDEDAGDLISNLKLQKLLYYTQGFNLAINGTPMFPEAIKAWEHGPVVPEVYHHFSKHGANPIPVDPEFNLESLSSDQKDLIGEVYSVYGQFSAWKLREMTHQESPWTETPRNEVIDAKKLTEFFKTLVK